jgi:cell division protein YceG involved in septum cleavage
MEKPTPAKTSSLRNVTIVLLLVLVICLVFLYKLYSQNEALKQGNTELQAKYSSSDSLLNKIAEEQKIIADTSTVVVNLAGTKTAPHSNASVYWDSTQASVYLVVKNMPQLPSDAQYQLWALIDGKPADLGVFDTPKDKVLLKMKDTKKADAFAITIEKKGGSVSPTLEKMQTYGKKG